MLAGSFTAVRASGEVSPAPHAFPRRPSRTRRRSHRACESSLRTDRWRGSSCTRWCRARRLRRREIPLSSVQLGGERARDARSRLAPESLADEFACAEELLEVYTGFDPQAVQHVDHVLGGDVAGRALGVGTAAQAGDRAVEGLHAQLERGVDVRERLAVGVVVVAPYFSDGDFLADRFDYGADLLWRSDAYGVAE